jgi:TM2 domain-containing membrane protein YozV
MTGINPFVGFTRALADVLDNHPPPQYGYPGQPAPNGGYPSQPRAYPSYPAPGYGVDPAAPYGRDPATGEPLSDKSAVAGGLLQIFFGMLGVGRFYIGSNTIAVVQLVSTIVSSMLVLAIIGVAILPLIWLWTFVDGIMIIAGAVKDGQGRKLR